MTASHHGVLCVDKPAGKTSHDVVAMARRALATRRVGHGGTLDPMATGLLVLGVGEGLKVLRYLTASDKHYAAEVVLGAETDTLDAEGIVVERSEVPAGIDLPRVREVAASFEGAQRQRAPLVSALRRDGERLHARVRRGEVVDAPERDVVVHRLVVEAVEGGRIRLQVWCGKGFYVRALARDLARALGTCGHLGALRRLTSGSHRVEDAAPAPLLEAAYRDEPGARASLARLVVPLPQALPAPVLTLDDQGVADAHHGRPVAPERVVEGELPGGAAEPVWLVDASGVALALARFDGDQLHVVRGLRF